MGQQYWIVSSSLLLAALFRAAPVASWAPVVSTRVTPAFSLVKTGTSASFSQSRSKACLRRLPTKLFSAVDLDQQALLEVSTATPAAVTIAPDVAAVEVPLPTPDQNIEELTRKLTNGLILAASFGYAAYTVLNIDHGMTRGWTQSEIAMRIPLDNWGAYESALQEFPVYTKTMINVVIYLLGDWLSQTLFQKKNPLDFDAMRVLRNGFIGLCFGPLVHEYYQFSDSILPPDGGIFIRLQKILMDQTIYLTIKCSIYIMAVGLLQGDSFETAKQNVRDRIKGIVFTAWKFWPLVHCITYGVIPARHRILWVNSVDLIWNAILATLSRKNEAEDNVFVAVKEEDELETALSMTTQESPEDMKSVVYNDMLAEPDVAPIVENSPSDTIIRPGNTTVAIA